MEFGSAVANGGKEIVREACGRKATPDVVQFLIDELKRVWFHS